MSNFERNPDAAIAALSEVSPSDLRAGLLQYQFLPTVRDDPSPIPPIFSSITFEEFVADSLITAQETEARERTKSDKYKHPHSYAQYNIRRFDGLIRHCGLPHPVPYSAVTSLLAKYWEELPPYLNSSYSKVKPLGHGDNKLVKMHYGDAQKRQLSQTELAHGKNFLLEADISSCFPSIYTHAIDWAIRGKEEAKTNRNPKPYEPKAWASRLDQLVRNCHRGESKGLMIGPAISNLLAELVLQKVDQALVNDGIDYFERWVDDYSIYCKTYEEAEHALTCLQRELAVYKLTLNGKKTSIRSLEKGLNDHWMIELEAAKPSNQSPLSIVRYLHHVEQLARKNPGLSVLKYALQVLELNKRLEDDNLLILNELFRLSWWYPHVLPFIDRQIAALEPDQELLPTSLIDLITDIMKLGARRQETDTVLWSLYILAKHFRSPLCGSIVRELLAMEDDLVALGLLALQPDSKPIIAASVNNWTFDDDDDYDSHWLIRYELHRLGLLEQNWEAILREQYWMDVLIDHDVTFLAADEAIQT